MRGFEGFRPPGGARLDVAHARGARRERGREACCSPGKPRSPRWARPRAGSGQVVGIVGEPRVGKSRLLYEFRRSVEAAPVTYLEGRCLSYGSATPYLPLQDIIRDNCGINSTDTPGQIGEKIRAALEQVGMNPEEARPYLLQVLGVKEGTEQLAQIEPRTIKARISDILRQMSMNGSRRRTLILAVEDLHRIDKTSEEYFSSAIEWLAGVPILLLMTYRPGYKPPWIDKSYATWRYALCRRQRASGSLNPWSSGQHPSLIPRLR